LGYEDCVDDPVLSGTRGHSRLTEFRIDDRALRDYSPPLIVNVRWILNNPQKLRFRRLTRRLVGDNSPVSRRQFYFRSPASDSNSSLLNLAKGRLDRFSAGLESAFSPPVTLDSTSGFLLVLVAMISRQSNRILTDGLGILTVPCPTGFSADLDRFFSVSAVRVTESLSGSGAKFLLEEKFA
jgi:hypothetical protein